MKKTILILCAVIFFAANAAFAEGMKSKKTMGKEEAKGSMMMDEDEGMRGGDGMGKGMMMGMCPMHGMMMKSMMGTSVVATSDGGIVVLGFGRLTKYDKNLNVVKEVELKNDMEGMQKMMTQMKGKCPMWQKMMPDMMGGMKNDSSKKPMSGESSSQEEHSSHHPEKK